MRLSKFALLLICVFWPAAAGAQTADIEPIVDTMVRLCLGGGRTEAVSGRGSGGADLSLRSLDVRGNLQGEFEVDRSNVEGLVEGINNAMSQVAADQADKVRSCLQPLRERILDIYFPSASNKNSEASSQPSTFTPEAADVLYETGIDKGGFEDWSLTSDWHRLNGMLLNDGTAEGGPGAGRNWGFPLPVFAPYAPASADYAVEAEIRVIEYGTGLGSLGFGFVVRADDQEDNRKGYAVGIGKVRKLVARVCYLGAERGIGDKEDCKPIGQSFTPDADWHRYRIEVEGNTVSMFIDNAIKTTAADNRFLSAGQVGLWSYKHQLEVRNFKVSRL